MSEQIACARRYMECYGSGDRDGVAGCLTDDVVWTVHGFARLEGKAAYLAEMERAEPPEGALEVTPERYFEDGNSVVVTGRVRSPLPDGAVFQAVFCDVLTFRRGLACEVESYVVPLSGDQFAAVE